MLKLVFLIGNWYTKDELGKRSNIFQASTALGTLISGVLQGGVHTTLNGKQGMPVSVYLELADIRDGDGSSSLVCSLSPPVMLSSFY
jgi:hypothetical protein